MPGLRTSVRCRQSSLIDSSPPFPCSHSSCPDGSFVYQPSTSRFVSSAASAYYRSCSASPRQNGNSGPDQCDESLRHLVSIYPGTIPLALRVARCRFGTVVAFAILSPSLATQDQGTKMRRQSTSGGIWPRDCPHLDCRHRTTRPSRSCSLRADFQNGASSDPSSSVGSSMLQWMRLVVAGKKGQISRALSQTVIT